MGEWVGWLGGCRNHFGINNWKTATSALLSEDRIWTNSALYIFISVNVYLVFDIINQLHSAHV